MTQHRISEIVRTQVQPYFWTAVTIWSLVIVGSYLFQVQQLKTTTLRQMEESARKEFLQDLTFRRWATGHGGVYVPVTEETLPNPFLKNMPEREVTTPSGRKLTLVNPAYMLRQIYEMRDMEGFESAHITSLKPLNPSNTPDPWEEEALKAFELGEKEVFSIEEFKGKEHFRLMRPLRTEPACLKCHGTQGYKVGQNRGGISISFPTEPWFTELNHSYVVFGLGHLLLWVFGLIGITFARNRIAYRIGLFEAQQEQLVRSKEKAEEADRTKSQFLANMSHEIRTPMNAIVGYADLLQEGELTPQEQTDALSIINRNSNHLVQIINDLLDLSKFETQSVVLIKQPLDLRKLMTEIFESSIADVDQKKVCPLLRLDESLAKHYLGDAVRIRQIVVNLLNNAIKFTTQGTIALKVELKSQEDSMHEIHILIEDSGVGMSPEYQAQIFKPFSQEDSTLSRKFGGAGLGLAIVKRLVDAMGGKIVISSETSAGSLFRVILRMPALNEDEEITISEQEAAISTDKYPHWVGKKILVVEDTATSAMILLSWLKKTNCELVFAENGHEALSIMAKQKFSLVIMDIQMPVIDGMTAAKQLRAQGNSTPLIALSAHAFAEQRQAAYEAGFNGYIIKPFHWADVRSEVERVLVALNHN